MADKKDEYKFDIEKTDTTEDTHERIDKVLKKEKKKFDPDSAQERIRRIHEIKNNPPEKGYMRQTLHEAEVKTTDENGDVHTDKFIAITDEKGEIEKDDEGNIILLDTILDIDLKKLADAQFADCASNIIPMLMDQTAITIANEKKEYKPEKPEKEFNWQWVIVGCSFIPMIIFGVGIFAGWW